MLITKNDIIKLDVSEKIFSSNCYMNTNHIKILDIDFVYKFINLPLPVGERILKAIQADKDFLLKEDFINLMFQLYYDNFDSLVVFFPLNCTKCSLGLYAPVHSK